MVVLIPQFSSPHHYKRDQCHSSTVIITSILIRLRFLQLIITVTETAMGYKSGESRSLMEQKEKETKMVLPNPPPLGTLGPILQVDKARKRKVLNIPPLRYTTCDFNESCGYVYSHLFALSM